MGCGLGVIYGFLQPLRPRWFADLLLLWALFDAWIRLVFGLCGGDLRFAYSACLLLGLGLWQLTFGQWLRPVFTVFWNGLFRIFCLVLLPFKKLGQKCEKYEIFSLQARKNRLQ